MKVKIAFTVDIDPEHWTLDYGVEGATAIREDVKTYVINGATDHLRDLGHLTEKS